MPKGVWADAEERTCPVCEQPFTAVRRAQLTCKGCRYTTKALALKAELRAQAGMSSLDPRPCEKCETVYTPRRPDQKTCGAQCPGVPYRDIQCAECGETVKATWRGETNQVYCSKACRDKAGRRRWETRFRRIGLTQAEYDAKNAAQAGRCMICGHQPRPHLKHPGLVADHCHKTEKNRDLLCANCNAGLGYFADDPGALRAAAVYIERWARAHAD